MIDAVIMNKTAVPTADIQHQRGFTLLEMVIGMTMGLIILAGLTMLFVSYNDSSRAVASRTERMGDLYLASHIMQAGLRESLSSEMSSPNTIHENLTTRSVSLPVGYPDAATFAAATLPYWDATSQTITYQDLEGNVGIFEYQRTISGTVQSERIYWLRPLPAGVSGTQTFQELMRDLDTTNGMEVFNPSTDVEVTGSGTLGGGLKVVLRSTYLNEDKVSRTLSLPFKIWPRN